MVWSPFWPRCGLTQQRDDHTRPTAGLEVGLSTAATPPAFDEKDPEMIIIGLDPHKSTHTATAIGPATSTQLGTLRITACLKDYQRLALTPGGGHLLARVIRGAISRG